MSRSNTEDGESTCLFCVQWFQNKNKQGTVYIAANNVKRTPAFGMVFSEGSKFKGIVH